uniref:ribosomal RNA small subunit methyltransferase, mitochondrial n=1 Tax=Erigeron canadensis TaxID=72917 RepID=UPI001CB9B115|nr:ribosomal RNA small subunit methyltransferase, mitochondrial [Erigeron canadensis]XP_043617887.1 ribosomal RNA small subunit methyltransferase, mitochondrial [Erigeron canadensis]
MLHHVKPSVNPSHILRNLAIRFHQIRAISNRSSFKNRHIEDNNVDTNYTRKRKDNQEEEEEERLQLHKSKGQHLLTNPRILDSIVKNSGVGPEDTVLEIGPGTGNLTMKLLEIARKVVAVELDTRMVDVLHKRVSDHRFRDNLTIICKDALKVDFPDFDLVVANIPYGISSPLVAKLVFGGYKFRSATLLFQKEFATRLLANPGDSEYNRLAVNVKLVADVEHVMNVSKRDFVPTPKVDSSVVNIRLKNEVPDVDLNEWWAFTKTCFGKKNKTLGATFRQKKKAAELLSLSKVTKVDEDVAQDDAWHISDNEDGDGDEDEDKEDEGNLLGTEANLFKEKLIGILRTAGLEDKRPSKLSNKELLHLLSLFNNEGICFHDQEKPLDINASFAAS